VRGLRILFYFLFLALVVGGFASIAQNDYGLKIVAWACFGFALAFLVEVLLNYRKYPAGIVVERIALTALFVLFGMRALYIHFPYVEWIVIGVALILIILYAQRAVRIYRETTGDNRLFSLLVLVYYASVIFFLSSIVVRPLEATISQVIGGVGGLMLGIFILGVLARPVHLIEGTETRLLSFVRQRRDHSSILMTGFLIASVYIGLNFLGLIPSLYTREVPQAYIELVNRAETGQEKAVDGKYTHDRYKEALDRLLERHGPESR
jgi:hypothetical protein